jgi:hypothetical protein
MIGSLDRHDGVPMQPGFAAIEGIKRTLVGGLSESIVFKLESAFIVDWHNPCASANLSCPIVSRNC